MTEKTEKTKPDTLPRGAIKVTAARPTGSVEAAAAAKGTPRPRARGPGKQIYCSDYLGELLAEWCAANGVHQKFFTDKALAAALEKEGVDVDLRARVKGYT